MIWAESGLSVSMMSGKGSIPGAGRLIPHIHGNHNKRRIHIDSRRPISQRWSLEGGGNKLRVVRQGIVAKLRSCNPNGAYVQLTSRIGRLDCTLVSASQR
jgi:hypothetical protein